MINRYFELRHMAHYSHYSPPLRLCQKFPIPCHLQPSNFLTWSPSSSGCRSPETESGFILGTSIWHVVKTEIWGAPGLIQEFSSTLWQNIGDLGSETDILRFIHLREIQHGVLSRSFLDFWFPYLHLGVGTKA